MEILEDLKLRGLKTAPELAIGDGALGFWKAIAKVYNKIRQQKCWVYKTANVLNKLPKSFQKKAKADLQEIWMAPTKQEAEKQFDAFIKIYESKYPKAVECLKKDRKALLTFQDFPRGALEAYKDNESNRISILDGKTQDSKGKKLFFIKDGCDNGFQALPVSPEKMATTSMQ